MTTTPLHRHGRAIDDDLRRVLHDATQQRATLRDMSGGLYQSCCAHGPAGAGTMPLAAIVSLHAVARAVCTIVTTDGSSPAGQVLTLDNYRRGAEQEHDVSYSGGVAVVDVPFSSSANDIILVRADALAACAFNLWLLLLPEQKTVAAIDGLVVVSEV